MVKILWVILATIAVLFLEYTQLIYGLNRIFTSEAIKEVGIAAAYRYMPSITHFLSLGVAYWGNPST